MNLFVALLVVDLGTDGGRTSRPWIDRRRSRKHGCSIIRGLPSKFPSLSKLEHTITNAINAIWGVQCTHLYLYHLLSLLLHTSPAIQRQHLYQLLDIIRNRIGRWWRLIAITIAHEYPFLAHLLQWNLLSVPLLSEIC